MGFAPLEHLLVLVYIISVFLSLFNLLYLKHNGNSNLDTILDIYRILLDRPRLKIKASYGFKIFTGGKGPPMMVVTIVNKGRRPIKLSATGLRLHGRKGDITRNPDWDEPRLPKMLNEFEDHVTYFDIDGVKQKLKELGVDARIAFGYYRDAADNLHKYKIPHDILKLLHE